MSDKINRGKTFAAKEFDFVGQEEATRSVSGTSSDTEELTDVEVDSFLDAKLDGKDSGMKEEDYKFIDAQIIGNDLNFAVSNAATDSASSAGVNAGGASQAGASDNDFAGNGFIPRFGSECWNTQNFEEKEESKGHREHGHRRFKYDANVDHGFHRSPRVGAHGHDHQGFGHHSAFGVHNHSHPIPGLSYFSPFVNNPPIGTQLPHGALTRSMARPFFGIPEPPSYVHNIFAPFAPGEDAHPPHYHHPHSPAPHHRHHHHPPSPPPSPPPPPPGPPRHHHHPQHPPSPPPSPPHHHHHSQRPPPHHQQPHAPEDPKKLGEAPRIACNSWGHKHECGPDIVFEYPVCYRGYAAREIPPPPPPGCFLYKGDPFPHWDEKNWDWECDDNNREASGRLRRRQRHLRMLRTASIVLLALLAFFYFLGAFAPVGPPPEPF